MTQTPTLTGQDIGQAERATRAVFDRLLAESGTTFHGWVILNDLNGNGPTLERSAQVSRLALALRVDEPAVRSALDDVVSQGLVGLTGTAAGTEVTLSAAGEARVRQVRTGIARIAARFYGDLPAEDLAAAHRVLAIVTERANAELAGAVARGRTTG
jgi:DNA-binding MarR family transcriptional regulator